MDAMMFETKIKKTRHGYRVDVYEDGVWYSSVEAATLEQVESYAAHYVLMGLDN
jgi:hypothetical protein